MQLRKRQTDMPYFFNIFKENNRKNQPSQHLENNYLIEGK
jgi:hypothetical protein